MDLDQVKGINQATRQKLRRSGVRTAEQLALADSRRRRISGITPGQLARFKRAAQRAIWEGAAHRVRNITDEAFDAIEGTLQEATWATVDAAKLAQQRAQEAVGAAQSRTRVLARVAAAKTRQAAQRADREYRALVRQLRRTSTKERRVLRVYEERARRAAEGARRASQAAARAVELANKRWRAELRLAAQRGATLMDRLKQNLAGNGGPG